MGKYSNFSKRNVRPRAFGDSQTPKLYQKMDNLSIRLNVPVVLISDLEVPHIWEICNGT